MYFLVAPLHVIAGYATRPEAEAERKRRKNTDPRYEFLAVIEASEEGDARRKALKFYDALERKTGKRWKS